MENVGSSPESRSRLYGPKVLWVNAEHMHNTKDTSATRTIAAPLLRDGVRYDWHGRSSANDLGSAASSPKRFSTWDFNRAAHTATACKVGRL